MLANSARRRHPTGHLKRSTDVVLFCSALIVFASFFVHEELRDELKDITAAIDSAQISFEARGDLALILDKLEKLNAFGGDVYARQASGKSFSLMGDHFDIQALLSQEGVYAIRIRAVETLANQLPDDSQLIPKITAIHKDFFELYGQTLDADNHIKQEIPSITSEEDARNAISKYVFPTTRAYATFDRELDDIENRVINQAQETQASLNRRYQIVNWLGAILFVVGWTFGLVTRLLGFPDDNVSA